MVEYNRCDWLLVGSLERCYKRCASSSIYCARHRSQLDIKPSYPCRKCSKGTQSESRLCSKKCGQDNAKKALRRAESKAKRNFSKVMSELIMLANLKRRYFFIGL